jgi:hypothetical protein
MTVNYLGLFATVAVLLILMAGSVWLDGRSGRREAKENEVERSAASRELPPAVEEFLSDLEGHLDMPGPVRAEIRLELADHLEDSIAAIESEGLDQDRATREALARLGRPEELARQLRHAHQSTRRLFAGAAGGVFQAGVGVVWGAFIGYAALVLAFVVGAILLNTALKPPLDFLAAHLPHVSTEQQNLATGIAFGAASAWFPAFLAARFGARACSRLSRRSMKSVGRAWALVGLLGIGFVVLFVYTAQQSWLVVPLELLIPVAFVAGALFKTGSTISIHGGKVAVAVAAVIAVVLPLGLFAVTSSSSGSPWISDGKQESLRWDQVAPSWTDPTTGPGIVGYASGNVSTSGFPGVIDRTFQVQDQATVAQFRDVRFELWRGVPFSGAPDWTMDYVPDPSYTTPFATQPATLVGGTIPVRFDVSHSRANRWLLFMTATGPDGRRYRLNWPEPITTSFNGTVWDWLTAGS